MMISIGEFIRFFRVRNKMTQQELADKLGITAKGLRNIGKGQSVPRSDTLALVEDHFKIKISRFYPSNTQMLSLETYRLMWEMLDHVDKGDLPRAFLRAHKLERLERQKNSLCYLNIAYVKARYAGEFQGDWKQAKDHVLTAISHADYMAFTDRLTIESVFPCRQEYAAVKFLGIVFLAMGEAPKAVQIFEEILTRMESILQDTPLRQIFSNLDELTNLYQNFLPELARTYYELGYYQQALKTSEPQSPLRFKALCKLGRFEEALNLLINVLSNASDKDVLKDQLIEEFPEIGTKIQGIFHLYLGASKLY